MGSFVPPFLSLEENNTATNKDGRSTPVSAQQNLGPWAPLIMPETPAKQRRTVHGTYKDLRPPPISNNQLHSQGSVKDLNRNLNSRKRPSTELSQFSTLQLDDAETSIPFILQDSGVEQPRRWGSRSMAPPSLLSAPAFLHSQPVSPKREWLPRFGRSMFHAPVSPEQLEYSQADTEYSNFFGRRILTDYREVRELGSGSFGKVTLYEETSTGAMVAIKVSPPLANPEQRQRFLQEKAILTLVRGFPHVVQLLEAWEEGRVPQMYLQMEYCKGGSVAEMAEIRRKRGVVWEEREVFIFLAHTALALDALHTANIVHVDFKPENVLIDDNGDYKLSDFGCSVILNEEGRPRRCFLQNGQRSYNLSTAANNNNNMSMVDIATLSMPTQLSIVSVEEGDCRYLCSDMLNQKRYLKEGDMFSFGISLFELMSGEPLPQHGAPFLELRSSPPVELLEHRGYSKPLIDLVVMLMHKDPTARPTARDVLRFFELPPQAPLLVKQLFTLENRACGNAEQKTTLLEMRYVHAALEVASRLVYVARLTFGGKWINNNSAFESGNNNNACGGGESQRQRADIVESCTPKTPIIVRRLDGG